MDRPRLSASRCPRFSPGQTIFLQSGGLMGRRTAARVGSGRGTLIALKHTNRTSDSKPPVRLSIGRDFLLYFFGDAAGLGAFGDVAGPGAFGGAAGAGVGAGLASISSTSKIRVELAPISGPTDLSP